MLLALVVLLAAPPASPAPSMPPPPGGAVDAELTRIANERAAVETKAALEQLDRDPSRSAAEKGQIRARLAKLKLAVFTTPKTLDETVAHYEKTLPKATFIFGERDLASDLREAVRSGAIKAAPGAMDQAAGRRGRSARWSRDDGALEIDIEDHLLDPRDGTITKKTIVLVTSIE